MQQLRPITVGQLRKIGSDPMKNTAAQERRPEAMKNTIALYRRSEADKTAAKKEVGGLDNTSALGAGGL